jgi:hypothetical protein
MVSEKMSSISFSYLWYFHCLSVIFFRLDFVLTVCFMPFFADNFTIQLIKFFQYSCIQYIVDFIAQTINRQTQLIMFYTKL